MKARKIRMGLMMGLTGIAVRTVEAASTLSHVSGTSPVEIFRDTHPIAMVFANIGLLVIILGVCAVAFAALAKGPNDL